MDEWIEVEIAGSPRTKGPIEVRSGAEQIGELKDGKLNIKFSSPGFYPIFLQAIAEDGTTIMSRPNTLIVE